MRIRLRGEELEPGADRTLYWARRRTLLVADLHLGRAASLGALGTPVPRGADADDLERLSSAVTRTGAERLVVLGDQYHHALGQQALLWTLLRMFRRRHTQLAWILVSGNHDLRSHPAPAALEIRAEEVLIEPPFCFRHDPVPSPAGYVLGGHLHPAVALGGTTRVPCFHFFREHGVLPAFGTMTGMVALPRERDDRIVAVAEGRLFPL